MAANWKCDEETRLKVKPSTTRVKHQLDQRGDNLSIKKEHIKYMNNDVNAFITIFLKMHQSPLEDAKQSPYYFKNW